MTTWKELLDTELIVQNEKWEDVVSMTLTSEQLYASFDEDIGGETQSVPFTVWTYSRVYFPARFGGAVWVASVARNPDGQPTQHI